MNILKFSNTVTDKKSFSHFYFQSFKKIMKYITSLLGAYVVISAARFALLEAPERKRCVILRLTIWSLVLCVWPILWTIVATCDGCDKYSLLVVTWPFVMMLMDVGALMVDSDNERVTIKIEPSILISVTFAVSGFMGAFKDPIRMRFFTTAIFLNLLFILPVPNGLAPGCELLEIISTLQRALTACSISLVLSGVAYTPPTFDPKTSF